MQTSQAMSADWTIVLARVETALGDAVARITEREHALASAPPIAQSTKPLDFAGFEKRRAGFVAYPQSTDKSLAQLDSALGAGEDALRQWLARAEGARKQLAAWEERCRIT